MQGNFQIDHDSSSEQPTSFFSDMQQLFGDDPDPLFLEESWTLGIPAAVENLRRRRQDLAERERQSRAFRSLGSLGAFDFVEDREQAVESLLADRAASIASRYDATWQRQATSESAALTPVQTSTPQAWAPEDWVREDRVPQTWIPQGWTPLAPQPSQLAHPSDVPLTLARARQILQLGESGTREQIRSAYRRMVGQWHPDRLQHPSEAARLRANQQMAILNEAYRMLCDALLEEAA